MTPEEIGQLVQSAGFSLTELAATTRDVIAQIDARTRLKPLLSAIRNAADLSVPTTILNDAKADIEFGEPLPRQMLRDWENEGASSSPNPAQVRSLLEYYNLLLRGKGQQEMTAAEIDKVVAVAEKDREDGLQRGFRKRATDHRPLSARRTITPDFDGGPSR